MTTTSIIGSTKVGGQLQNRTSIFLKPNSKEKPDASRAQLRRGASTRLPLILCWVALCAGLSDRKLCGESPSQVIVVDQIHGAWADCDGNEALLVFYPGGKVLATQSKVVDLPLSNWHVVGSWRSLGTERYEVRWPDQEPQVFNFDPKSHDVLLSPHGSCSIKMGSPKHLDAVRAWAARARDDRGK